MVEIFPESSEDLELSNRRIAQAVVDAAIICREEVGEEGISWPSRQALIEAVNQNPLLIGPLFVRELEN